MLRHDALRGLARKRNNHLKYEGSSSLVEKVGKPKRGLLTGTRMNAVRDFAS